MSWMIVLSSAHGDTDLDFDFFLVGAHDARASNGWRFGFDLSSIQSCDLNPGKPLGEQSRRLLLNLASTSLIVCLSRNTAKCLHAASQQLLDVEWRSSADPDAGGGSCTQRSRAHNGIAGKRHTAKPPSSRTLSAQPGSVVRRTISSAMPAMLSKHHLGI